VCGLDERALIELVPAQSGLSFVGCPNCTAGHQEHQLVWSPERPQELRCKYCGHRYPSAKYPMKDTLEVRGPDGTPQRYPYWASPNGYRSYFQARRDYAAREYLEARARDLAQLYAATGERGYAWRAALIIDRFAQVFPHWCYHYDYPFQQKIIYDGDVPPAQFRGGYRTARWSRWAYRDIPIALVEAYETIRSSGVFEELARRRGVDVAARIERDLFGAAAQQVLANPETYHNMSPTMWYSLLRTGRALNDSSYQREVLRRLRVFLDTRFFYDGSWMEGAPSYHGQIRRDLEHVTSALGEGEAPKDAIERTNAALLKLRLPDGRLVPLHDTWHYDKLGATDESKPFLLTGVGHALLGGGRGSRQTQFHLTWSGGYGHQHADNLSLIAFAHGRELLSDIGYTHTKYRSWAVATASHNTVVIDGENQFAGRPGSPSDGELRWFDASDALVQAVSAGGERGYPGKAKLLRRTLIVVGAGEVGEYAVDLFEVDGGTTHDYFLHGDADRPSRVVANLDTAPLATLLPARFAWRPTRNEGEAGQSALAHYAYGFLRNTRSAPAADGKAIRAVFAPRETQGPALRASLFPEAQSTLVVGENPSIRSAGEDDDKLDACMRPFVMLRHRAANGRSRFVAVLEPYGSSTMLERVDLLEVAGVKLALRVVSGDRADLLVVGAPQSAALTTDNATFSGEVGVLRVRAGKVEHAYALGTGGWRYGAYRHAGRDRVDTALIGATASTITVDAPAPPRIGSVVRLLTADGWVYPFTVAAASSQGNRHTLQVSEVPGLSYDATQKLLRFAAFPARDHHGAARVDWYR